MVKVVNSKQLISQDDRSNTYNFKYTFSAEIPKICKDDLIVIPEKLRKILGCSSYLGLCQKVCSNIHIIDISDGKVYELNTKNYYQFESDIQLIPLQKNSTEFMVMNIEIIPADLNKSINNSHVGHKLDVNNVIKLIQIEIARTNDWEVFHTRSHLQNLAIGQLVAGFDLSTIPFIQELNLKTNIETIIVKRVIDKEKAKERKRLWRLKRLDIELAEVKKEKKKNEDDKDDKDFEEFLDDIELDKDFGSKLMVVLVIIGNFRFYLRQK